MVAVSLKKKKNFFFFFFFFSFFFFFFIFFFFQAEDGIRDLVRSRGLGDVYKRQFVGSLGWNTLTEWEPAGKAETPSEFPIPDATLALSLIHI